MVDAASTALPRIKKVRERNFDQPAKSSSINHLASSVDTALVLNEMNQQFTLLSQEETAEVKRREGLIKNLTDDFVTLGDWEK